MSKLYEYLESVKYKYMPARTDEEIIQKILDAESIIDDIMSDEDGEYSSDYENVFYELGELYRAAEERNLMNIIKEKLKEIR